MKTSEKLRAIRKAEGLTQAKFCEISGVALSSLKNYEGGHKEPGLQIVKQVVNAAPFKKYTLWLMTDETAPEAGQISPAVAHCGQDDTNLSPSDRKTG
ncbi:helix-turn-helix domain-containing protein [Citrobacter enshiensis]|uniref:helix-turn-helix domain-containing protein n=1 Tax=Citrobacter enshiensis TaxID=2971264 RepID=UPI0023E8F085|nr:helix-turn-helix transcriptional regulator [Citrobacter enshiensis]WET40540.1 helix-turn-helix transcriptional regulator [Citrobacter enshiensis]